MKLVLLWLFVSISVAIVVRGPITGALSCGQLSLKDAACGAVTALTNGSTAITSNGLALVAPNEVEVTVAGTNCAAVATTIAVHVSVLPPKTVVVYPVAADAIVRLNLGGPAFTDPSGKNWTAETGYTGGQAIVTTNTITNSSKPKLYQSEREDITALSIATPAAGTYLVRLHFAELYWNATGKRIFSVRAHNTTLVSNLDIFARVGRDKPLVLAYRVTLINTNRLDLAFVPTTYSSSISGIEVLPDASTPTPTTVKPTTTAPVTTSPKPTLPATTTPTPTTTKPTTPTPTAPSCSDGVKNGDEAQVDCGGSKCGPCEWPFNAVPRATLRASPRKVYAHWHIFPLSYSKGNASSDFYQTAYVSPSGENNKHFPYGGFLRERPLPRLARTESNWQALDAEEDVRLASQMGIDGFFLNVWTTSDASGYWTRWNNVIDAASTIGNFDIIPNLDLSIIKDLTDAAATNLTLSLFSAWKTRPSLLKKPDGRFAFGTYGADKRSPAFYANLKTRANGELGIGLYIIGVLPGQGDATQITNYRDVIDEYTGWGTAIPTTGGKYNATKQLCAKAGRPWMQPISNQDFRPYTFSWWEASNTKTIRTQWEAVIAEQIESVQLITWNDQGEHHAIRPSTGKQWVAYDLDAYYIQWFKTRVQPLIKREVLFYSHRIQNISAPFDATKQNRSFVCKANCPGTNLVEVISFLLSPGVVQIRQGAEVKNFSVPAGLSSVTTTLQVGTPSFQLLRGSAAVLSFSSSFAVLASNTWQDFLYRGGSSARVALATSGGTCASFCSAYDTARCNWCPAEPMWLKR